MRREVERKVELRREREAEKVKDVDVCRYCLAGFGGNLDVTGFSPGDSVTVTPSGKYFYCSHSSV